MKSANLRRIIPLCACLLTVALSCGDGPAGLNDFVPCEGPEPSSENAGFIHGTVIAAEDDSPIDGAAVRLDGVEGCVSTDNDGRFEFPLAGGGGFKMTVTASGRTHGRRIDSVVAGRDISLSQFALPKRDTAVTMIGPSGGTHRSAKGGLEITFPAGALDEIREVSATRFEAGRELPGKLPETSHFTMAIEAVAGDGDLDEPVIITIPNDYGFPPGTPVPVGVFDEETGEWVPDGMGVISEDGTQVVYEARHFSAFDCNYPVTSSGRPGLAGKDPRRKKDPCKRNSSSGNSIVDIRSGVLRLDVDMPVGRRGGIVRQTGLVYQSGAATPYAWTGGPWEDQAADPKTPEYAGVEVQVEGVMARAYMDSSPDGNWAAYMWDGRNGRGELMPTGLYDGWIRVYNAERGTFAQAAVFGGQPTGSLGIEADEVVEADTTIVTRFQFINGGESPVGNGWYIKGIPDLYRHPDGSAMIVIDGESGGVFTPDVRADIFAGGGDGTDCGEGVSKDNRCIEYPKDLAVAPDGSLLTTDDFYNRIIRINTDGTVSTVFSGESGGFDFRSVAVAPDGTVYFADSYSGKVFKLIDGQPVFVVGGDYPDIFGTTPSVSSPTDLDFDANGNLFIADWPLGLRVFTTEGVLENAYAGDNPDIPAPVAIDVAGDGSVLLAEPVRQRVRRLTADGRILPVAGLDGDEGFDGDGRPAAKARLYMPGGVVQGPDGTVYIADEYNDRIRTVGVDGIIRTFAGKGNISGSSNGDGGPATETMIDVPSAPVFAADGNLLVLDHQAGVIWKYDLSSRVFARPASEQGVLDVADGGGLVYSSADGEYTFDDDGRLTAFTGADGVAVAVGRDAQARVTSLQWADGDAVQFTWGANGLTGISGPGDRAMNITANGDRNITAVTVAGVQTTFGYDGNGRLAGWTDADGRTADYTLDKWGRVTAVESADGATRLYKPLETQGLINDLITAGTGVTPDDPAPAISMPLAEYTDAAGLKWMYQYDALGEASAITQPDGTIITLGNHTCGMPSLIDVPGAYNRRYFYDEWGRLLVDKGPEGGTEYTWAPYPGGLTGVSTPGWRMTNFEYDEDGRMVAIKTGSTLLYSFTYAEGARLAGMTDGLGRETVYEYDDRDNLLKVTQSDVKVATFERDEVGNITSITDAMDAKTSFGLDSSGLVATITDRAGATHSIGRDGQGQVTSIATAADDVTDGLSTVWGRDDRGRVNSVTINGAGPWTLDMDGEDRVTSIASPAGQVTATYDARGRVVSRTISEAGAASPSSTATYTYDADGNMIGAVDDDSSIAWEYDQSTGALKSVTQQYAGMAEAVTILYEMDGDGVVMAVEYPALAGFDGGRFEYGNDGATGLLTEIYAPDGVDFDLIRDEAGHITEYEIEWGESFELVRDYDVRGYLQAVTAYDDYYRENAHMQFSYIAGNDGAITSVTGTGGSTVYSYDPMRRLTQKSVAEPDPDESFSYNGRGEPAGSGVSYDAYRRMTGGGGSFTYAYDDAGRVTSRTHNVDGTRLELAWDGDDNLVEARTYAFGSLTPDHTVSYGYDALGRRVWREQDGVRQFFIYDFADIVLEMNESGGADAFYLHEPARDNPLAMYRGGEWYACIVDGLGSVRGLVRLSDRTLVRTWLYSAFGSVIAATGNVLFRYGFQARETDPVTGLIHFRARELDPAIGRFISTDPLKFTSFANTYNFPGNDPVNRRDPTGAGPRAVTVAGEVYSTYNDGKQELEKFADSTVSKVAGREAGAAAGYIWKSTGSGMIDNFAKIPLPTPYQSPGPSVTDAAVYLYKAYKAKDPCGRAKVGGDVLVDIMPAGDKWLRPMVDNFNNFGNMMNAGN